MAFKSNIYLSAIYKKSTLSIFKDKNRLKAQGWKKTYYANTNQKEAGVTVLILDKVVFTARNITWI